MKPNLHYGNVVYAHSNSESFPDNFKKIQSNFAIV